MMILYHISLHGSLREGHYYYLNQFLHGKKGKTSLKCRHTSDDIYHKFNKLDTTVNLITQLLTRGNINLDTSKYLCKAGASN